MLISDFQYLSWQKKLTAHKAFRQFWTFWALYSTVIVILPGFYYLFTHQIGIIILAFVSFILARFIVSPLIYVFYKKQRPYQRLNFTTIHSVLLSTATKKWNAFPSDHAIGFVSISVVYYFFNPFLGLALLLVSIFSGVARVVLGYHDFVDIISGWVLGAGVAIGTIYLLGPSLIK